MILVVDVGVVVGCDVGCELVVEVFVVEGFVLFGIV